VSKFPVISESSFINVIRQFVDWLSGTIEGLIREKNGRESGFNRKYEKLVDEYQYFTSPKQLSKEIAYIFTNKILFYKLLERHYPELAKHELKPLSVRDSKTYIRELEQYFQRAVNVTGAYKAIFSTGIHDHLEIPRDVGVIDKINNFISKMDEFRLDDSDSDVIGRIHEELILSSERHAQGQFYTPPSIAELITKWSIRHKNDKVLDPSCGSGTFLMKAYGRFLDLKGLDSTNELVHQDILGQIYGIDINSFPLQLATMNLISRYPRRPLKNVNISCQDFFSFQGECFDVILTNPPYTRWTEIPENTRNLIQERIGSTLKRYRLTAQVQRGIEPGIYIHFIMHSCEMLNNKGRIGMIISDSWLQTDYGVFFGQYLLDNFKIKAIMDISSRVFPVPLIGACIILLEKCQDFEEREENHTIFMYLDLKDGNDFDVDALLKIIENPKLNDGKFLVKSEPQKKLHVDDKWINRFFDSKDILKKIRLKTCRLGDFFEPSYGNATYLYLTSRGKTRGPRNLGTKNFFYLNKSKVARYGLEKHAHPALTSVRYSRWFTFTEDDWKKLREKDAPCYLFLCHEPKEELAENVRSYIEWGETECRTSIRGSRGGGKPCNEALACLARERSKDTFHGWYDLGGVKHSPIMAVYQSQYKTRFISFQFPVITYHAALTFIPKIDFNQEQLKALLCFLNSSFAQLYIETRARITGMGVAALEVKHAEEMPILDVSKLNQENIRKMATLFDALEKRARKLGGADKSQNVEALWDSIIMEIDAEICKILGIPVKQARATKRLAQVMMKRRLQRTQRTRPEGIKTLKTN